MEGKNWYNENGLIDGARDFSSKEPLLFTIKEGWYDELLWMPSQCYLPIDVNGVGCVIYLRWRESDPWTCNLIYGCTLTSFIIDGVGKWIDIDIPFLSDKEEIGLVHQKALIAVNSYLNNI